MTIHRDGLDRQARNPAEVPDAGPKVENAQAFQEGITGGQTSRRQVGTPHGDPIGYLAFYCGHKLFLDTKGAAEFYAQCCPVIELHEGPALPNGDGT